jgi:protein-tyrosine phosphatase
MTKDLVTGSGKMLALGNHPNPVKHRLIGGSFLTEKTRICFVCLGNIVRSPLAENVFRSLAEEAGAAGRFEVASAGTSGWHLDEPPDARMRKVAASRGLTYTGRAQRFTRQDFERFDLILAMDKDNREDLLGMAPNAAAKAKVRLLREFDPHGGPNHPVPDPYYGGITGFEEVYQIIERSCRGLLASLKNGSKGEAGP